MEEPPGKNRRGDHEQAKDLVADSEPSLLSSPLLLGDLLGMRLDAGLYHEVCGIRVTCMQASCFGSRLSIGSSPVPIEYTEHFHLLLADDAANQNVRSRIQINC